MTTKWMPLMGTGLTVRMDMLNDGQARINHGQSLDRLAERGGLGRKTMEEAIKEAAK